MKGETRYIVKLKDLSSFSNRRALNLIGVVVEFSVPRRTSGTDYCTILKIIDQSQQSPELSVNVFMRNIDELPHLRSHKDIILLCNFKVESFNESHYAVYDHKNSSFALFDGEVTCEFTPYQVSPTFHSARSDDDFVRRLRNWSKITAFDAGHSNYAISLKDMGRHDFVDLVCKVLHVCEVSSGKWMLFVWDGTDAPALDLKAELGADESNSLPLQVEPTILPTCVLYNFPHIGTVLRVMIDETYENFGNHFRIVRDWVRMRNLHCRTVSGLWKGVLTPTTKIRPLSKDDDSVRARMRDYTERTSNCLPPLISGTSNFWTDVQDFDQAGFTTLMELLTSPLVDGKSKCVVRFLEVYPSHAKDFRSPTGDYRMRITLEDPTARIHALLCFEDAVDFFGGHLDIDVLATKMNKLLGVTQSRNSSRNPPWTICCIGFNSSDPKDVLGSRQYYICNTKLIL